MWRLRTSRYVVFTQRRYKIKQYRIFLLNGSFILENTDEHTIFVVINIPSTNGYPLFLLSFSYFAIISGYGLYFCSRYALFISPVIDNLFYGNETILYLLGMAYLGLAFPCPFALHAPSVMPSRKPHVRLSATTFGRRQSTATAGVAMGRHAAGCPADRLPNHCGMRFHGRGERHWTCMGYRSHFFRRHARHLLGTTASTVHSVFLESDSLG